MRSKRKAGAGRPHPKLKTQPIRRKGITIISGVNLPTIGLRPIVRIRKIGRRCTHTPYQYSQALIAPLRYNDLHGMFTLQ